MSIEFKILDFIQTLHTPVLDKIMVGVTKLGDVGIIWIILTAILLIIPKTRRTGGVMLVALVVQTVLCNVILKNLFARTRPYDVNTTVQLLVPKLHDFSFPSGHTSASFTAVSALYFSKDKLWKPALILACLIAVSRLYLYVHYPTDVLGGLLLGVLSGYIGYKIMEKVKNKGIPGRGDNYEYWDNCFYRRIDDGISDSGNTGRIISRQREEMKKCRMWSFRHIARTERWFLL